MVQDKDLLGRIAGGDKSAMKALYERHSGPLFQFLRTRIGGDAFEAADVMQEAFIEVWRSAGRYEGRSSVKTWLFGIARNKAIDRIRKLSRTSVQEPDEAVADDAPNPEEVITAASDAVQLRNCIDKLGGPHKSAIRLAFFDDLSYPEVAEVEGVPVGTIKTRIHKAKQLLMQCLTG